MNPRFFNWLKMDNAPQNEIKAHWQEIYAHDEPRKRGWYQDKLGIDAAFIAQNQHAAQRGFIDIGAGVSALARFVLDEISDDVSMLDISQNALDQAKSKFSDQDQKRVDFICEDILNWRPQRRYGIWHDRAMFHFLHSQIDQSQYIKTLNRALHPGGKFIVSGFAPDGPERCSGLAVNRLESTKLARLLGENFSLERAEFDTHMTPSGRTQNYAHFLFSKIS